MKKFITIFCLVASLLIILDSINFGDAIIFFLFAGIIPGTNIQLSPEQMFGLSAIATSLVVVYFKSSIEQRQSPNSRKSQSKTRRLSKV